MRGHSERAAQATAGDAQAEGRRLLEEALVRGQRELLGGIAVQVRRFGLATKRETIAERASEVFQETVVAALDGADGYDPSRSAMLWLLGVAMIVIKRKIRERGRDSRISLVADSKQVRQTAGDEKAKRMSEAELFDMLSRPPKGQSPKQSTTAEELLSLVEGDDREILRLHYLEGLDGEQLAAKYGVSKEAAYQRLSRARIRLRRAYFCEQN